MPIEFHIYLFILEILELICLFVAFECLFIEFILSSFLNPDPSPMVRTYI